MLRKKKQPGFIVCGNLTELQVGQLRNRGLFAGGKVSGPSLETTKSFAQGVLRDTSSAIKWPGLEAHHSSLSSAEVRYILTH